MTKDLYPEQIKEKKKKPLQFNNKKINNLTFKMVRFPAADKMEQTGKT